MTAPTHRRGRGAGDRDPLPLIHPFASTGRVWEAVARDLEDGFEVLAPTLPGHFGGKSFPPGVAAGVRALADWLERRLDTLGWDRVHIAGNSLGGWLALELATRGRARSVVALAPAGGWRPGSRAARRIERTLTVRRALGRPLLPHAERLCSAALGRRLLFGLFSANPGRLDPAAATYDFRASIACPAYRELVRAGTREHVRDLDGSAAPYCWRGPRRIACSRSRATGAR